MERTDREYAAQLQELKDRLLRMAGQVEEMIECAVSALLNGDVQLAKETIGRDARVNRQEIETDELCLLILARWQPMASDLRFVTLSLKMVTDLERIGDLAVNVCERAVDLAGLKMPWNWNKVSQMADLVRSMVHDAIDGFVLENAGRAEQVIERDDEVDKLYAEALNELVALMREDTASIPACIHALSVAKWLERMADHSTNLAEQVVFMVRGKDIRHLGKRTSDTN